MNKLFNFLLLFGVLLIPEETHAQNKPLSKQIPILKKYDQNHLYRIGLPIGGIGTGTVSLGGNGALKDWEIMNVPAKGYSTVTTGNDAPFFAIYTKGKEDKTSKTKALLGPIHFADYEHYEGRSVDHHGFPRFREADFETTYPFGIVNLKDKTMPVQVKMVGYNPFIPANADASGIPIAILKYEVTNTTNKELEVAVAGNIRNFIGKDGSKFKSDWKGDFIPIGTDENKNEYRKSEVVQGIYMYADSVDKNDAAWGTFAITTPNENAAQISYRTSSVKNDWYNSTLNFWDEFSENGELVEKEKSADPDPMASLSVKKMIKAGETKTFTFYLTWHFPNRYAWSSEKLKNYYATKYADAWDVITKEVNNLPKLTAQTLDFVNTYTNSTYSDQLKEAALFNLSTLRSQTVFRIEDGKMFGWEGVMDRKGSCFGSCTHVWNYEQATPFLFSDLARGMREVEFKYAMNEEGHMGFRTKLPLKEGASGIDLAAADGQMGTIMKFYRDWQLSGDDAFLEEMWPKVKLALSYAWIENGWDGDQDGVMEGVQHNTMDVEYYGPNPQMQIWYLGALKAAEKMALEVKDKAFAKKCNQLFTYGSEWTDAHLFNGEYYEHKLQVPASKDAIPNGLIGHNRKKQLDLEDPFYQLESGCLVDQLVGQYMAHVVGLGYLVKEENVKTSLKSILKYNQRDGMYEHFNNMRSYAMGDEKALLMASWPNGGRPRVPFPYWAEVMTGFEYTAAVGMLYEGMDTEGQEVIKNIRDRYDGKKRSPFDEAECGHHYARAMASWAGILAESDFQYSGVEKSIQFVGKEGNYFWANGEAWGNCIIDKEGEEYVVKLNVKYGKLNVKTIEIGDQKKSYKSTKEVSPSEPLEFRLKNVL
ncbi:GH116 family glycosyl-hydrolase [Flammeovirga pacifica]|uniref:GH116 family glycosyl-hydrolase n=1 Tax=Flammeovirga pacifica TaxID=915059 RepID=UPI0009FF432E|nr:GH116 family glycosyl-hydrolase [Flammeovirga pacifica]